MWEYRNMSTETKKMTMADIASLAGVAKSTVSRYFNGGYVKEETKDRIRNIVEKTGFEPSAAAQNLKLKKTKTVGIVVPTLTSDVSSREIMAMDDELKKAGYTSIIINTSHDPQREIEAIEYLRSMRTDGIILIATNINEDHQRLQRESSVPFLVMGQRFSQGTSVVYDDEGAGHLVGKVIRDLGHKKVAYLGVDESDEAVGKIRKKAVLEGLGFEDGSGRVDVYETSFEFEDALKAADEILDHSGYSAIICATDRMALACHRQISTRRLKIPQDISLISFGGYEISQMITPPLTTVRFDARTAGKICARTLIAMTEKEPVPSMQLIGFTLSQGQSVADRRREQD